MFKKVLIVDDIDVVNKGVEALLVSLGVENIIYSTYCDDALLKLKRASIDMEPFDLIISDLSFTQDHRNRTITSGEDLLQAVKVLFPDLQRVVFSVEEHPAIINKVWEDIGVDAYISKDRMGLQELSKALSRVWEGSKYLPRRLQMLLKQTNTVVLTSYDEQLLALLAHGLTQNEIEAHFKNEGITPSSRSTIEKRLKDLREEFEANTNVHLITKLKDYKLI